MWKARIAGVEKLNNLISVAFFAFRFTFEDIRRPPELNEILICMGNLLPICRPIRADIVGRLGVFIESTLIHHAMNKAKGVPKNEFY